MSQAETTRMADWHQLARTAAIRQAGSEEESLLHEFLLLGLADTAYAVPVERVREIVRMRPITPLPGVPPAIVGILSLRGEMIQVIDLQLRLGLEAIQPARSSRIVIVQAADGQAAGLLVDAVTEVLRVPDEAIAAPSGESNTVIALCVRGEQFVSLLDVDEVLELGADD